MTDNLKQRLRDSGLVIQHSERKRIADLIEQLEADRQLQLELKTTYMRQLNDVETQLAAVQTERSELLAAGKSMLSAFCGNLHEFSALEQERAEAAMRAAIAQGEKND